MPSEDKTSVLSKGLIYTERSLTGDNQLLLIETIPYAGGYVIKNHYIPKYTQRKFLLTTRAASQKNPDYVLT